jgi:hypothetical protein
LHHLEALLGCCSADVDIVISILDVEDNELGETVTTAKGSELVLPIEVCIDLIGSHGEDIDNLHKGGDFVDQNQGSKATQVLGKLFRQQDQIILTNGCYLH